MTKYSTLSPGRHLRILAAVLTAMLAGLLLHSPAAVALPSEAQSLAVESYVWPPDPAFLSMAAATTAPIPVSGEMRMNFTVARPATRVQIVLVDASQVTERFLSWKQPVGENHRCPGLRCVLSRQATQKESTHCGKPPFTSPTVQTPRYGQRNSEPAHRQRMTFLKLLLTSLTQP